MTEDIAEGKPQTRIYWRESDAIPGDVEWTDRPPTGSLDGWHGVDVDEETWEAYTSARRAHDRAVRQMTEAQQRRDRATNELWREAGVGRVVGRSR